MPELTKSYDPTKVTVAINAKVLTGFAPESVIGIVANADTNTLVVGSQGDAAYTVSADRSGVATIQLMLTSASLPDLRNIAARNTPVRLSVTDANDFDPVKLDVEDCRIQKIPDYNRDKDQKSVSIAIIIPHLEYR